MTEDPKKWTQAKIAVALGVTQQAVAQWFDISNTTSCKANTDARVSIPTAKREEVIERINAGEKQSQVAADFGVSQSRISQVVKQEAYKQAGQRSPANRKTRNRQREGRSRKGK